MLGRAARNKVERILEHISKQERKTCWSGTSDDADALRLAWWTLWFAAYQEATLPYDAALRKMLGPRYQAYIQSRNLVTLPLAEAEEPEVREVDGRNGSQWMRSVLAYLDWRSGVSWRSQSERNHPQRRAYLDASLCLTQAFNAPDPPALPKKKIAGKATATRARRSA